MEAEGGVTKYPVTLKAGWTQKKQMQSWVNGFETIDTKGQKVIEFFFNSKGKVKCRKMRGAVTPCSLLPKLEWAANRLLILLIYWESLTFFES